MSSPNQILSYEEYAALHHDVPHVFEVAGGDSRLLVFGSRHTADPQDPMFDRLQHLFEDFAPELALHEGTPPAPEPEREIAIRRHCEAGLIVHLATRSQIDTESLDIPLRDEARMLRRHLSRGDALVFLVVRQLASYNRKTLRMEFNQYFDDFFSLIAPSLELAINWPLIRREHRRLLGYPLAADQVSGAETDPMQSRLPTQRIAAISNRLRDEHILRRLEHARTTHHRVLACLGVTHAVMLEPALRGNG